MTGKFTHVIEEMTNLVILTEEKSRREGLEPYHPKHCGPCWQCKFVQVPPTVIAMVEDDRG